MNIQIRTPLIFAVLAMLASTSNTFGKEVCENQMPEVGYLSNFQQLEIGKDQWLFREHDLITNFGPNRSGYNGLRALNNALRARGTELVMVPLPTRGIAHPEKLGDIEFSLNKARKNYSLYLNRLRKIGVTVPDLTELTKGDLAGEIYFARDHHWTPEGAEITAQLIAEHFSDSDSLAGIPKLQLETTRIKTDSATGSYSRAADELCGVEFPPEIFNVYYTEAELDLFSEVAEPRVVLVGTSNSNGAKDFNFAGFLMESLGVDVMNVALSGGGFDESLLQYLASKEFSTHPPKLLIWEVPGYYSLNQASFYDSLEQILGE